MQNMKLVDTGQSTKESRFRKNEDGEKHTNEKYKEKLDSVHQKFRKISLTDAKESEQHNNTNRFRENPTNLNNSICKQNKIKTDGIVQQSSRESKNVAESLFEWKAKKNMRPTRQFRDTLQHNSITVDSSQGQSWPELPPTTDKNHNKRSQSMMPEDQSTVHDLGNRNNASLFKNFNVPLRTPRSRLQSCPKLTSYSYSSDTAETRLQNSSFDDKFNDKKNRIESRRVSKSVSESGGPSHATEPSDNKSGRADVLTIIDEMNRQRSLMKERQKMSKIQKQEEKRKKHEEAVLRERLAPKCQSIKIIDQSVKEKLTNQVQEIKKTDFSSAQLSTDFPALGNNFHNKRKKNDSIRHSIRENTISEGDEEQFRVDTCSEKAAGGETSSTGSCLKDNANRKRNPKDSKKKPKVKDPIMLNIFEAIKVIEHKQKKTACVSKMLNAQRKRKHILSAGGNSLDSDRPLRKSGKVRPNKQKRITPIKAVVLKERQLKAEQKQRLKTELERSGIIELNSLINIDGVILLKTNNISHGKCHINNNSISKNVTDNINETVHSFTYNSCEDISGPSFATKSQEVPNDVTKNDLNIATDELMHKNKEIPRVQPVISEQIDPKKLIHSRKFKIYCDQWPTKEMVQAVSELLSTLLHFQERMHDRDPIKAAAKRRFNLGMREVSKYLGFGKVKLLIIATDIDEVTGEGGLFDTVTKMREIAETHNVPFVFANSRWGFKTIMKKKSPISCIAVRNYEGAEEPFKRILQLLPETQKLYREKLQEAEIKCGIIPKENEVDQNSLIIQSMLEKLSSSNKASAEQKEVSKEKETNCPFLSALS